MNSLEKISNKILDDGKAECEKILNSGLEKAKEISNKTEREAKEIIFEAKKLAVTNSKLANEKASSSAALQSQKTILEFKIEQINKTLIEAKSFLHSMSDKDYFDTLTKLAKSNAQKEQAIMLLSKRDLERLPNNFEQSVCNATGAQIKISSNPAEIKDGFILVYGDIEIDCTFDALFDTYRDELRDIVNETLF